MPKVSTNTAEGRKVIIAGDAALHKFFAEQFTDWDCQAPATSVKAMWDGLGNGLLSEDSEIVILCDTLYAEEQDEFGNKLDTLETREVFAEAVSELAPNALVLVLSYEPDLQDEIMSDVYAQRANQEYRRAHGKNVPFDFIPYETAVVSIDEAIDFYDNEATAVQEFQNSAKAAAKNIVVGDTSSNHHVFNKTGAVITVTSSKGGSGKSTVAVCLGALMSLSSKKAVERGILDEAIKVCVVDLDTFDGQLGFVLNHSVPTSLNIALANTPIDDELVWNNLVYSERMGLHALLAPVRGTTARYTDAKFYTDVIGHLRKMFDVIILDTSVQHYDEIIKHVALPLADAILLVTTLDIKSVKGLARWLKVAAETKEQGGHELDMDKVGVVINGSIQGVGIGKPELTAAAMDAEILVSIPMDSKAVQAAGNAGRLEDIVKEHPTIGPSYFKLANKLKNVVRTEFVPIIETDDGPSAINPVRQTNTTPTRGGGATGKPKEKASGSWWRKAR